MVYLLHFSQRISEDHTTQHYLGYCDSGNLETRLQAHRQGHGARLTQVANERNITFTCVRIWYGTRALERQLKRRKESPRLCPVCAGISAWQRAASMTGKPATGVPF